MEKCKFCGAELEENSSVCPDCGKDNALQTDAPAEETVTAPEAERASAEAQDAPAEEQKEPAQSGVLLTPGTLAVILRHLPGDAVPARGVFCQCGKGEPHDRPATDNRRGQPPGGPVLPAARPAYTYRRRYMPCVGSDFTYL